MTYEVKKGPFVIGVLNSGYDVASNQEVSLVLDEIRTSEGVVSGDLGIKKGLAFSDVYFYDTGGGAGNYMTQASHSPKSGAGFGSDVTPGYDNSVCGSSVGCAVYSNDKVQIVYRERLDQNHSVDKSMIIVL